MKRPILIITLGFIIGIIMGLYFYIAPFIFLGLIFICLFFKIIKFRIRNNYIRILNIFIKNNILLIFFISAFVSSVFFICVNKKFESIYNNFKDTNNITATVISEKRETEYKNKYKIRLEGMENINLILRISKSKKIELKYGDKIKVKGRYIVPEQSRNYGGFNYREYLKTQKVYGIFEVDKIEIVEHNALSFIELFSNKIKIKIIENFNTILPNETNQLFLGILIGYDDNLSEEVEESFRKSSLTHLLAVSGAHIAYIITGLSFLFRKSKFTKKVTNSITIIFLIFFMYVTDFSSSVVRASIMGILLLVSTIMYRKNDLKTSISLSLLLILIENPYKLFDIGLVLSYFATIGIICYSKFKTNEKSENNFKEKIKNYIKEMALITIFANIFVMPIMIYNFNTISLTFVISNLIAGILIGPITIGGFILIIISFVNFKIAHIIGVPYNLLLELLIKSTKFTSMIPLSEILVPTPSIVIVAIYYILLFLYILYIFLKREYSNRYLISKIFKNIFKYFKFIKKNLKIIIIYIIVCLILITLILKIIPKGLKLYFIDVGQGDSTLVITPTNKKILIDSGGAETGNFDVGKSTLLPYLLDRKIISLDYICISHFDSDHCDGFKYLLNNIKVKNIILSKQYETNDNFEEIMDIVDKKKINILKAEAGNILNIDRFVKFRIFSPDKALIEDINDNSIVVKLEYFEFSCLFTGDISKSVEKNLTNKYGEALKATVLKVAHHGSNTSSDENFIKSVSPKVSLIGVGKENKFGHPNKEVIEKLERINSRIYRTDLNGEISIYINKKRRYKNRYIY